jgi:hypothetical protein
VYGDTWGRGVLKVIMLEKRTNPLSGEDIKKFFSDHLEWWLKMHSRRSSSQIVEFRSFKNAT